MKELDELYAYVENLQLDENVKVWSGSFEGGESLRLVSLEHG